MRLTRAAVPIAALIAALATPNLGTPQTPGILAEETERAVLVTVHWEDKGEVSVEKVEKKEVPIPSQQGFPQLWGRFFELRSQDKDGDVYFSGPLLDRRRSYAGEPPPPPNATYNLVVPDLAEARHLVIVERISDDPETGRKVRAEKDLP